ncbi:MAG: hypothetical protein PF961_21770 [Planctomycetota bacterium]|jgi:hypothetical protein|nr:hypothetical protein [Planctomycetota bacterium]
MAKLVTPDVLALHDKYQGNFGLMDERWADSNDRQNVTSEQCQTLAEYIDLLRQSKVSNLSDRLRTQNEHQMAQLECQIDDSVIQELRIRSMT